jgi:hypothetical protein
MKSSIIFYPAVSTVAVSWIGYAYAKTGKRSKNFYFDYGAGGFVLGPSTGLNHTNRHSFCNKTTGGNHEKGNLFFAMLRYPIDYDLLFNRKQSTVLRYLCA